MSSQVKVKEEQQQEVSEQFQSKQLLVKHLLFEMRVESRCHDDDVN